MRGGEVSGARELQAIMREHMGRIPQCGVAEVAAWDVAEHYHFDLFIRWDAPPLPATSVARTVAKGEVAYELWRHLAHHTMTCQCWGKKYQAVAAHYRKQMANK